MSNTKHCDLYLHNHDLRAANLISHLHELHQFYATLFVPNNFGRKKQCMFNNNMHHYYFIQ